MTDFSAERISFSSRFFFFIFNKIKFKYMCHSGFCIFSIGLGGWIGRYFKDISRAVKDV